MPFAKGQSGNPSGRKPGPTRATREFRETVTKVLEENSENVGKWLTRVAEGERITGDDGQIEVLSPADPAKALDLLAKLAEYASPKLARTESHVTPGSEKSHEEWLNELE
jgi:hypothetical protein